MIPKKHHVTAKGFTLAELVIVIGILGLLFGITANIYGNQRQRFQFDDSVQQIISLINTARNYATTSRATYDPSKPVDQRSYIPPDGYGVFIKKATGEFILFANTLGGQQYKDGDVIEEKFTLPSVTKFEAIINGLVQTTSPDNTVPQAVMIFKPPLADTFISNNGDPNIDANLIDTLTIKLSYIGSPDIPTAKRLIRINKTAGFPELTIPKT